MALGRLFRSRRDVTLGRGRVLGSRRRALRSDRTTGVLESTRGVFSLLLERGEGVGILLSGTWLCEEYSAIRSISLSATL